MIILTVTHCPGSVSQSVTKSCSACADAPGRVCAHLTPQRAVREDCPAAGREAGWDREPGGERVGSHLVQGIFRGWTVLS